MGKPRKRNKVYRFGQFILIGVYGIIMGAGLFGAYKGYKLMMTHARFDIRRLELRGTSLRTRQEVTRLIEPLRGQNLFRAPLREVRHQLEQLDWVDDVTLRRDLPDQVAIHIQEREIQGLCRIEDQLFVFDMDNQVIAPYRAIFGLKAFSHQAMSQRFGLSAPIITGIPTLASATTQLQKGRHLLDQIWSDCPTFWPHIDELNLSDPENMMIQTPLFTAPIYLGDQLVPGNLSRLMVLCDHLQVEYPQLEYIDLAIPYQVIIKPVDLAVTQGRTP
jgi:hypothetical protein